ncbi:hypothetical protein [Haloglomus salinum]|uniref:hypothetical protein n=1 Tax=Haloglomus salinum TaxID=2962673 RepID=UPI0020C9D43F|nr:hypothetical protein [Haloglomus salinum]
MTSGRAYGQGYWCGLAYVDAGSDAPAAHAPTADGAANRRDSHDARHHWSTE